MAGRRGSPGTFRETDRMSLLQRHRPRESKLIANKHRILNRIFREPGCSRLYLARKLNINASTIGNYVDEFLRNGLLVEDHEGPTRRGRSPVPVWLNPAYGRFLGVDLEALRVRTVLTDFAGEVVAQEEVGLRAGLGREAVLEIVLDAAKRTAQAAGDRLLAVGVAAPGRLDLGRGRIVRYDLLPDFEDVPLLDRFRPHFDCPIYIEENIRALTLAELLRGIGRGHRHFLCLAARSGFGMGIVIDGRIYTGTHARAGKVGRMAFPRDGQAWAMTELVSAKGIVRQAIRALKSAGKTPGRRALGEGRRPLAGRPRRRGRRRRSPDPRPARAGRPGPGSGHRQPRQPVRAGEDHPRRRGPLLLPPGPRDARGLVPPVHHPGDPPGDRLDRWIALGFRRRDGRRLPGVPQDLPRRGGCPARERPLAGPCRRAIARPWLSRASCGRLGW